MKQRKNTRRERDTPVSIHLNVIRAKEIVKLTGCTPHYAQVLVRHRPYARAEDLLRVPELCSGVPASRVLRLLFSWGHVEGEDVPPPLGALLQSFTLRGGTRLEVQAQPGGNNRISLRHPLGTELISGEICEDRHEGIEPSSIRMLGVWPHELLRWKASLGLAAANLLRSEGAIEAASLWRGELPELKDKRARQGAQRLSRDLAVVQHLCQEAAKLSDEADDPEWNWVTDGCGSGGVPVPDGDWVECCNKHDLCYSLKGDTFVGRWQCDNALADCIASKGEGISAVGHCVVSVIYWCGVRIGGTVTSHRGDPLETEWPDNRKPPLFHEGVDRGCEYWLRLLSIEQIRDPSGLEDFEIEFSHGPGEPVTNRAKAQIPFRGEKSYGALGEVVMTGKTVHCGGRARNRLYIRCVTTEIGKMFFFDILCDGGEEEYTLIMPIRHGSGARFRLTLRLDTTCVYVP